MSSFRCGKKGLRLLEIPLAEPIDLEQDTEMNHRFCLSALVLLGFGLTADQAQGCSCAAPPPNATAQELADWRGEGTDVIFEGTVQSGRLDSVLLQAPAGEVVPASLEEGTPKIIVTFTDNRWYKGSQQNRVEVETGLGGGDCGFPFELGKRYLVYASKEDSGRLSTGICSATGLAQDKEGDLAFLRGEQVPAKRRHQSASPWPSGTLCVKLERDGSDPAADSRVQLLRVGGVSPFPTEEAELEQNGRYCARSLDPGQYRVLFSNSVGEIAVTSFLYYPGVRSLDDAERVEVKANNIAPDLLFKIPPQQTFSFEGKVATSNNSPLPPNTKVVLLTADDSFLGPMYGQEIALDGSFVVPKVLSGRYWALLDVESESSKVKWSTIKTEVVVSGDVQNVLLTLIPN